MKRLCVSLVNWEGTMTDIRKILTLREVVFSELGREARRR